MALGLLSEVLDDLPARAVECKVTISEANWAELIEGLSQHVAYGTTLRKAVPCETKKGRKTRAFFCVWINRRDDGFYEHGCNT